MARQLRVENVGILDHLNAKKDAAELKGVKIHLESQGEAIAELEPKTAQKINDLTAAKDIGKAKARDKQV